MQGSPPADDGRLLLSAEEKEDLIHKYPELNKIIKPFIGSREFINDTSFTRYCIWMVNSEPSNFSHIPELIERFKYIREYRLNSSVDRIRKTAETPYLFTQNRQPEENYLFIPRVSSSNRRYIPIGFLNPDIISSDSAVLVSNASLIDFSIITSNVHQAWVKVIAGRLKNDYRYAPSVFYNFPFPSLDNASLIKLEKAAKNILDARKLYSNKSLADMYGDNMFLYPKLLEAHQYNDKVVMETYGFDWRVMSESDCVAELMKLYTNL